MAKADNAFGKAS